MCVHAGRTALDYALQQYLEPISLSGRLRYVLQQLLDRAVFGTSVEVKLNRHAMFSPLHISPVPLSPLVSFASVQLLKDMLKDNW